MTDGLASRKCPNPSSKRRGDDVFTRFFYRNSWKPYDKPYINFRYHPSYRNFRIKKKKKKKKKTQGKYRDAAYLCLQWLTRLIVEESNITLQEKLQEK